MNKKVIYTMIALAFFVTGCRYTKTEQSDVITEKAIVADVAYTPSRHGSSVGPTLDLTGEGGFGIAVTSVSIPEKYAVVFKCEHGKFISEGTDQRHKEQWERLVEGQEVTVYYREIYRVTYEDDHVVARELYDLDFIEAR